MNSFGDILRELRLKNELTGDELGKILNVTKVAISNYENNRRNPDHATLVKISNYFDVSIDYLLGNKDIKRVPKDEPINTDKETDLEKAIDELMEQQGLMLSGEALTEEDIFLLRNAIRNTLEFAKSMKEKK